MTDGYSIYWTTQESGGYLCLFGVWEESSFQQQLPYLSVLLICKDLRCSDKDTTRTEPSNTIGSQSSGLSRPVECVISGASGTAARRA